MVFKPRLSLNFCFVDDFDDDPAVKGERLSGKQPGSRSTEERNICGNRQGKAEESMLIFPRALLNVIRLAGEYKKEMWNSGEIGGFDCYVLADDEAAEASDVYKEDPDDDGPLVQTLAQSNTLSIVLQVRLHLLLSPPLPPLPSCPPALLPMTGPL